MGVSHEPVGLEASQRKRAAHLLTEAFQDDPLYRTVMPEAARRRRALLWLHDRVVQYCLLYGTVQTTCSLEAVACWLPPGETDITVARIIRTGLYAMMPKMGYGACLRFSHYIKYSDRLRGENAPERYWYLWVLGVSPQFQGQGIGGELIRTVLDRADVEGMACYLETENEENLGFYEKHGFRIVADGMVPGIGLHTWSMIRQPGPAVRM